MLWTYSDDRHGTHGKILAGRCRPQHASQALQQVMFIATKKLCGASKQRDSHARSELQGKDLNTMCFIKHLLSNMAATVMWDL